MVSGSFFHTTLSKPCSHISHALTTTSCIFCSWSYSNRSSGCLCTAELRWIVRRSPAHTHDPGCRSSAVLRASSWEPGTRARSGSSGRLRRTPCCRAPHNEAPCQSRSAGCAENLHPSRNMGEGRQPQITVLAKSQRRERFLSFALSPLTLSDGKWWLALRSAEMALADSGHVAE